MSSNRVSSRYKQAAEGFTKSESSPFIEDEARTQSTDLMTLRDADKKPVARVSQSAYLLAHAMMNQPHSVQSVPSLRSLPPVPQGVFSKHKNVQHEHFESHVLKANMPSMHRIDEERSAKNNHTDEESNARRHVQYRHQVEDDVRSRHSDSSRRSKHSHRDRDRERDDHVHEIPRFDQHNTRDGDSQRSSRRDDRRDDRRDNHRDDRRYDGRESHRDDDRDDRRDNRRGDRRDDRRRRKEHKHKKDDQDREAHKKADLRMELVKIKNSGLDQVVIPAPEASLSVYESEYERWTLFIVSQSRVQYMQTVIRTAGGFVYVVLKLFGAWWIEGWLISISNELEDPSMHQALESFYVKHFDYTTPSSERKLITTLIYVTVMTVVANLTSQTFLSQYFNGKYGKTAQPVRINASPVERVTTPTPENANRQPEAGNFGSGFMPSAMRVMAGIMPKIISGLSGGGGFSGIISSLFSGGQAPAAQASAPNFSDRPIQVVPPNMQPRERLAPWIESE